MLTKVRLEHSKISILHIALIDISVLPAINNDLIARK